MEFWVGEIRNPTIENVELSGPFATDQPDPLHCNALLTEGRWLDDNFRNWQPDGACCHILRQPLRTLRLHQAV